MANLISKKLDEYKIRKIEKAVKATEDLALKYALMSDAELKAETPRLKELLKNGSTLDEIMPEAFATAREACRRVVGEYPYHVQLIGAAVLQGGDIAEMKTGEGKTLTSVMAVYLNALTGDGVHVVTVNEYLSQRDAEWMGAVHRFLGLTVGLNLRSMSKYEKQKAYKCDITYSTNAELGFDYLRDNMAKRRADKVQRGLNFALVDEVDSILIDDSRTPLIISGGERDLADLYVVADNFAKSLKKDVDYEVDLKDKTARLLPEGIEKAETRFGIENLYDLENTQLLHRIDQAIKANYAMTKDVEYVVNAESMEVEIVDPNTGRIMKGREWSDGLHQAVCAKEGMPIQQESVVLATITYQNFFRLYKKLSGMTGTAKTEEEEFHEIYNMLVYPIPTNRPVIRKDDIDLIYGTKKAKYKAIVNRIKDIHSTGQPVLVGTVAVETSELISGMLQKEHIPHEVLNAKNHAREAEIIAKAGQKNAVTIATNMAGRGTDIKLGDGVKDLGGLFVLGTERHESRRIDNQLRGRSGRQGDPGESVFYVSIEDDLMRRFGSERMTNIFMDFGDEAMESKAVSKSIEAAQKKVEGVNFDARKRLLQYDDVLRQQREVIYQQRDYLLEHSDVHSVVKNTFERTVNRIVYQNSDPDTWKVEAEDIIKDLDTLGIKITAEDIAGRKGKALSSSLFEKVWNEYEEKIEPIKDTINSFERQTILTLMDRAWVNHIDTMSKLREGISLRSYGHDDPLQAYISEGFMMFEDMTITIDNAVVSVLVNMQVPKEENKQPQESDTGSDTSN